MARLVNCRCMASRTPRLRSPPGSLQTAGNWSCGVPHWFIAGPGPDRTAELDLALRGSAGRADAPWCARPAPRTQDRRSMRRFPPGSRGTMKALHLLPVTGRSASPEPKRHARPDGSRLPARAGSCPGRSRSACPGFEPRPGYLSDNDPGHHRRTRLRGRCGLERVAEDSRRRGGQSLRQRFDVASASFNQQEQNQRLVRVVAGSSVTATHLVAPSLPSRSQFADD